MMTVWALSAVPDGWPSFEGKIYWEEVIFSGYWIAWWRVGVCFPTRSAPSLLVPCSCADPASSQGTIQFISSGPCQRICCCLQRAALKLLGRCSFSGCVCQPHEVIVSSPGGGSPSTLCFLVGAPIPVGTAAVAHVWDRGVPPALSGTRIAQGTACQEAGNRNKWRRTPLLLSTEAIFGATILRVVLLAFHILTFQHICLTYSLHYWVFSYRSSLSSHCSDFLCPICVVHTVSSAPYVCETITPGIKGAYPLSPCTQHLRASASF